VANTPLKKTLLNEVKSSGERAFNKHCLISTIVTKNDITFDKINKL